MLFAQIITNWVYYQLLRVVPDAVPFTLQECLFGFSRTRCKRIPKVIRWMLLVVKHQIWVSHCDHRFRNVVPVEAKCLNAAMAPTLHLLRVSVAKSFSSPQKRELFEQAWLGGGVLGHFGGAKVVFTWA